MPFKAETLQHLNTNEDDLIRRCIKDVRAVFTDMVGVEDLMHLPLQIDVTTHFKDCLTAMVGLAGTYNGLVSVHVPCPLAMSFTSLMLDSEVMEINDDVNDALGEIANMISGSFKQHLSKGGADIHLSTPSIVNGADYMVSTGAAVENITLKFAADEEWFMVSYTIKE